MFGKFNIAGALRDQGVNACSISEGRNADAQFPFADYTRQQLAQVNHLVDHIYLGFIQKVRQPLLALSLYHLSVHACLGLCSCLRSEKDARRRLGGSISLAIFCLTDRIPAGHDSEGKT